MLPVLVALAVAGSSRAQEPPAAAHAKESREGKDGKEGRVLVGSVSRQQVEAAVPEWMLTEVEAKPDARAVAALAALATSAPGTPGAPGAEVTVFLGTWCSDSRREVSRLWRVLDDLGGAGGEPPFTLHYVAVDEAKQQPASSISEAGVKYVPTFIVRRQGRELGRIIERSPHGIEIDLLALLDGSTHGVVSASPKVAPEGGNPVPTAHPSR